jgi:hypothetical protein
MKISKSELENLKFSKVGDISFVDGTIKFHVNSNNENKGVYLWLSMNSERKFKVCYAGKAGSGPRIRMRQHQQGITRATQERIDAFTTLINDSNSINNKNKKCLEIWFRESRCAHVEFNDLNLEISNLESQVISYYSLEEEVLIKYFRPVLNRAMIINDVSYENILQELNRDTDRYSQIEMWFSANINQRQFDYLFKASNGALKKLIKRKKAAFKIIGSYSSIATGYANKPLLVFGKYSRGSKNTFKERYILIKINPLDKFVAIHRDFVIDPPNDDEFIDLNVDELNGKLKLGS